MLTSSNITCLNIQGPHTVFTENKQYQDVGIFRKFDKQWNAFMEKKRIIDADHARQGVSLTCTDFRTLGIPYWIIRKLFRLILKHLKRLLISTIKTSTFSLGEVGRV